jgi:hypothetical protein
MDVWPRQLFRPAEETWRLANVSSMGPPSVSGITQTVASGAGFWTCEQREISLSSRDQIRAWRAWEALLDGGATQFILPMCDRRYGPVPITGGGSLPHSDDTYFSDDAGYLSGGSEVVAEAAGGGPGPGPTVLTVAASAGVNFRGGEHFSIDHTTKGARLYRTVRINDDGTIEIRPPLREPIPDGTYLDFVNPRCTMKLSNPQQFAATLRMNRFAKTTATFVEAF